MSCVKCEIKRASLVATTMLFLSIKPEEVARTLSNLNGENYYYERGKIWRASKLPPYEPHFIKEVTNDQTNT